LISRSTERDISPYRGRQNNFTGYNSDSGRPPLVSPLRGLTSPDLFVPVSNKTTDDDDRVYQKTRSSSDQIMYATTHYRAQRPEDLSFSKNDKIKILSKESHSLWYAEHVQTGTRGYVSPNRIHSNVKETYSEVQRSTARKTSADIHSISEIPRLDNSSRRVQQKSVKFDNDD
jgi:hypothetical protein